MTPDILVIMEERKMQKTNLTMIGLTNPIKQRTLANNSSQGQKCSKEGANWESNEGRLHNNQDAEAAGGLWYGKANRTV